MFHINFNLHSNLFILIPLQHLAIPNHVNNLHSNLFILIHKGLDIATPSADLHSNLFILIHFKSIRRY